MQVIHTHAACPGISVSDKKVHVNEIIIFLFFVWWPSYSDLTLSMSQCYSRNRHVISSVLTKP